MFSINSILVCVSVQWCMPTVAREALSESALRTCETAIAIVYGRGYYLKTKTNQESNLLCVGLMVRKARKQSAVQPYMYLQTVGLLVAGSTVDRNSTVPCFLAVYTTTHTSSKSLYRYGSFFTSFP